MRTKTYIDGNGTKVTVKSMSPAMVVYVVNETGITAKMGQKNFMKKFKKVEE